MAPEYCSHCWSIGPLAVSAARSWSRQSFWLSRRLLAVVDDERRVAAGPVGDRGLDVDLDRETVGDLDRLRRARCATNRWKPRPRRCRSSSSVGKPGSSTVAERSTWSARNGVVEVVAVEVGDVEEVGPLDRRPCSSGGSWSLRGNTNHEPKNAGTNHGSHTIEAVRGLDQDAGVAERGGAHRPR